MPRYLLAPVVPLLRNSAAFTHTHTQTHLRDVTPDVKADKTFAITPVIKDTREDISAIVLYSFITSVGHLRQMLRFS